MTDLDTIVKTDGLPEEVQQLIAKKGNCWPYLGLLYLEARKAETILELGVGIGRSTRTLLCGCRDGRGGFLWSVDWDKGLTPRTVAEIIENLGLSKYWEWVRQDFFDIPDEWFKSHPVDLVWIDIGVSQTGIPISPDRTFFEMVRKCSLSLKTGGRLLLHNICHNQRAREDLLRFIENGGYKHQEILTMHGLGIITKI